MKCEFKLPFIGEYEVKLTKKSYNSPRSQRMTEVHNNKEESTVNHFNKVDFPQESKQVSKQPHQLKLSQLKQDSIGYALPLSSKASAQPDLNHKFKASYDYSQIMKNWAHIPGSLQ